MKKLLFLFSFLMAAAITWSQPFFVTVSGTVLDTDGQPVEGVEIHILTDSFPAGYSGYNFVAYTNSAGIYSKDLPLNLNFGFVGVSMLNCPGVPNQVQVFFAQPGFNPVADFTWCDNNAGACPVNFAYDATGNPNAMLLTANPGGSAPFSYLWNTGETSQTITVTAPGQYCVTVANGDGCTAVACQEIGGSQDCWAYIAFQAGSTFNLLTAEAWGEAPFSYNWSTGETTPVISTAEEGNFCVTVTDANGCVATPCITVQQPTQNYIAGAIFPADSDGFPLDSISLPGILEGQVYLIQYDPVAGTLTAVDTRDFSGLAGAIFYNFGQQPPGAYLIKAFLDPDSDWYEDFLPTYHHSSLFWHEASEVVVPNPAYSFYYIFLIPGDNPGGPGFIGGLVSEGANIWSGGGDNRGAGGEPLAGVSVLLFNNQEAPVTHTLTAADGSFAFPDIAYGTYKVVVEIPGLEQGEKWVTIGPDKPSVGNISFEVGENGILAAVKNIGKPIESVVYPNPAKEQISLSLSLEQGARGLLTLSTPDGRVVMTQPLELTGGGQTISIPLEGLSPGVYALQAITGQGTASHIIVIE
jgi:hypothetical protein